ncbi:MAG: hypothetical protein GEU88_09400 [Solirubrobacterales bacterium]|nr:hypothetical protein [Solirubrobacterales bacterium]
MSEPGPCPLCGQPLYGWLALPRQGAEATVGMPLPGEPEAERVMVRCESCGIALEDDREVDLVAEWEAVCTADERGGRRIAIPNRASLQAWIGTEGWAAIDLSAGRLLLTPRGLELLAEHNGQRIERPRYPRWGRPQWWMWQTLLNGLTFHPNFAREVRAGSLRPSSSRGRLHFAADAVASVLAAPLVAVVSIPLELLAALAGRGGELRTAPRPR